MSYTVTREEILNVGADAAVLCVEATFSVSEAPSCRRMDDAGGDALRAAIRRQGFLPVGSCAPAEIAALPFRHIFLCAAPHWLTGKANELLILHRCYQNLFALARELGCKSLAVPFLSVEYYRFPRQEAVHIALAEAAETDLSVRFIADTEELLSISRAPYRKPEIASYIGWYRDHALFALDDGRFVRVDLRPERREIALVPYFEPCYRVGNNPLQTPLPESEIARLRQVYAETSW